METNGLITGRDADDGNILTLGTTIDWSLRKGPFVGELPIKIFSEGLWGIGVGLELLDLADEKKRQDPWEYVDVVAAIGSRVWPYGTILAGGYFLTKEVIIPMSERAYIDFTTNKRNQDEIRKFNTAATQSGFSNMIMMNFNFSF